MKENKIKSKVIWIKEKRKEIGEKSRKNLWKFPRFDWCNKFLKKCKWPNYPYYYKLILIKKFNFILIINLIII